MNVMNLVQNVCSIDALNRVVAVNQLMPERWDVLIALNVALYRQHFFRIDNVLIQPKAGTSNSENIRQCIL